MHVSALQSLKKEIGSPHALAHLKLKAALSQGQIAPDNQNILRYFHKKIKRTIIYLSSIGYIHDKSTEKYY